MVNVTAGMIPLARRPSSHDTFWQLILRVDTARSNGAVPGCVVASASAGRRRQFLSGLAVVAAAAGARVVVAYQAAADRVDLPRLPEQQAVALAADLTSQPADTPTVLVLPRLELPLGSTLRLFTSLAERPHTYVLAGADPDSAPLMFEPPAQIDHFAVVQHEHAVLLHEKTALHLLGGPAGG